MALTTSYLVSAKNFDAIFTALLTAKAPATLSTTFLKTLGFTSSNDSLYIRLFRDLGLIDSANVPTEKYFRFLDQSESKKVIAECIEEAYSDLFAINKTAYELPESEIKNKLKTLTQGSKEDNILALMAKTFKVLCDYADWNKSKTNTHNPQEKSDAKIVEPVKDLQIDHPNIDKKNNKPSLHYNIQIHLPETRDTAVYDAIFKSLKEHLL